MIFEFGSQFLIPILTQEKGEGNPNKTKPLYNYIYIYICNLYKHMIYTILKF